MKHVTAALTGLALIGVSLVGYDMASYAATGQSLILGKRNSAGATTTVVSGKGAAFSLVTKPGRPPLQVNRKAKVANLNADLLDGEHASALKTRATRFTVGRRTSSATTLDTPLVGIAPGSYLLTYAVTLSGVDDTTCMIRRGPSGGAYTALSYGASFGSLAYRTHHVSTILVVTASDDLSLRCQSPAAINYASGSDTSYVDLVAVDRLSTRTAPTERRAP